MAVYYDPFNKNTFKEIFGPWVRIINHQECGSIVHLPKRDQLYRLNQFIQSTSFLKKHLSDFSRIQMLPVDLVALALDDYQDIEEYLSKKLNKHKKPVLIILDADRLIMEKRNLLSFFDSIYHKKSGSILYLFQKNITYKKYLKDLSSYTTLFQNMVVFPYYNIDDSRLFIDYLKLTFGKVPDQIQQNIINECGGCFWLIKQAVRYYSQTRDIQQLFSHDDIKIKLQILYKEYEPEERHIMQKIVLKQFNFKSEDRECLSHLLKTKLIKQQKGKFSLTIPLLQDIIKNDIKEKNRLEIKNNTIELNGVSIEIFLSKSEKKLLRLFLEKHNQIISRMKIASILWGEIDQNQYTDWALDQMMYRFRKKLAKLDLDNNLIKTVKNKGFIYQM